MKFYIFGQHLNIQNKKSFQREKEGKKGKSQTVTTQSSLNHDIGEIVHDKEYGTKEFDYLISKSPGKNYVPIIIFLDHASKVPF